MIHIIPLLVFILFCGTIRQTNGQEECVPRPVANVSMLDNGTITWQLASNEVCTIDHFIINVQYSLGQIQDTFVTTVPVLDVTYLSLCQYWIFSITAVSTEYITGGIHHLISKIPMPLDTDLSLNIINMTYIDDYVFLEWQLQNPSNTRCADRYRLTIVDENFNLINDVAVAAQSFQIYGVAACGTYDISVRAIHTGIPEIEGAINTTRIHEPPRAINPPRLQNITHGLTFFGMYLELDSLAINRCPIYTIYVNGSPYFNLTYPVQNVVVRPQYFVNVTSLRANSMYVYSVTVENSAGLSVPVRAAVQTLPYQLDTPDNV